MQVENFFNFTSFLTGLAFLIMAWLNTDYKYRLRLRMSRFSLRVMLVLVAILGALVLISDFVIAQGYPIPCTPCVQHFWQLLLAVAFLALTISWIIVCFLKPPAFKKSNYQKFQQELLRVLECGREDEIPAIAELIALSIERIVRCIRPNGNQQRISLKQILEEESALNIIKLMADERFCRFIARYEPKLALSLFEQMTAQGKQNFWVNHFAGSFITQVLSNEESFIVSETNSRFSSLSDERPILSVVYRNTEWIQKFPELLMPDDRLIRNWDRRQVHAYCEILRMALVASMEKQDFSPKNFSNCFALLERSAWRIGRATDSLDFYGDENRWVYRTIIGSYEDLVNEVSLHPIARLNARYTDDIEKQDVLDLLADSIVGLMFVAASFYTRGGFPYVGDLTLCLYILDFETNDELKKRNDELTKRICRSLYCTFKKEPGIRGIHILFFLLYGLGRKNTCGPIRLLKRFVDCYARHHLLSMIDKAKKTRKWNMPEEFFLEGHVLRMKHNPKFFEESNEEVLELIE